MDLSRELVASNLGIELHRTIVSCIFFADDIWSNIGLPSIMFGCETVNFSDHAIQEISRHQSNIAKFTLGLPSSAPNIAGAVILGLKPFKQLLFSAQLKFYVRLSLRGNERWSKQA